MSWGLGGKSVPDPDLARDGMLQDASALHLDRGRGRREESTWQMPIKNDISESIAREGGIMASLGIPTAARTSWIPIYTSNHNN
jgi:hypothetical protein